MKKISAKLVHQYYIETAGLSNLERAFITGLRDGLRVTSLLIRNKNKGAITIFDTYDSYVKLRIPGNFYQFPDLHLGFSRDLMIERSKNKNTVDQACKETFGIPLQDGIFASEVDYHNFCKSIYEKQHLINTDSLIKLAIYTIYCGMLFKWKSIITIRCGGNDILKVDLKTPGMAIAAMTYLNTLVNQVAFTDPKHKSMAELKASDDFHFIVNYNTRKREKISYPNYLNLTDDNRIPKIRWMQQYREEKDATANRERSFRQFTGLSKLGE